MPIDVFGGGDTFPKVLGRAISVFSLLEGNSLLIREITE